MSDLAQLRGLLETLVKRVDELHMTLVAQQPPLTITQFAQRVGLSRWTIAKRVAEGEIRRKGNRIPYSELRKFTT